MDFVGDQNTSSITMFSARLTNSKEYLGVVKQLWGQKGNHGMDLWSTKLALKLLENGKAVPSTSAKLLGLCYVLFGYVCKT